MGDSRDRRRLEALSLGTEEGKRDQGKEGICADLQPSLAL